jgi:hypothetical protein
MVDITIEDGTTIVATDQHPFWDATRGRFIIAAELQRGHEVRLVDDAFARVTKTRTYVADVVAHNLTVAGMHTYYAGRTPVLVHNASCGHGSTPGGRPYSKHGAERAAERGISGDQIDTVLDNQKGIRRGKDARVYYDPDQNLTVVTGRRGIVSTRKGVPSGRAPWVPGF